MRLLLVLMLVACGGRGTSCPPPKHPVADSGSDPAGQAMCPVRR